MFPDEIRQGVDWFDVSVVDPGGYVVYFNSCRGGQDYLVRPLPSGLESRRPVSLDEDPIPRAELVGCGWRAYLV